MKRNILLFCLMLLSAVAMAKDIKTAVFTTTPQMHCANCEKKIKSNMRFVKGVKAIETDVPQQRVTIEYDADKATIEAILKGFEKIGYAARQLKPGETVQPQTAEKCENM